MSEIKVNSIKGVGASAAAITVNNTDGTCTANVTNNLSNKNKIINGSFAIDQRNGNASVTLSNGVFPCDRFRSNSSGPYLDGQVVTDSPDDITQSLKITTNGNHTIGTNDFANLQYVIEGHDIQDLNWGTSAGVSCTLSFFVKSSLTGTFGGAIRSSSSGGFYGYPFTYTISSANTFEKKSITIPKPPDASTWLTDANGGIYIYFDFGTGSTYTNAAGSWVNQNVVGANGTTKLALTNSATQQFALVQFEKGTVATDFEHRSFAQELALCQRYCYKHEIDQSNGPYAFQYESAHKFVQDFFPVTMRTTPSYTITYNTSSPTPYRVNPSMFKAYVSSAYDSGQPIHMASAIYFAEF